MKPAGCVLGLLIVAGCAAGPKVWSNPDAISRSNLTYAILPFSDENLPESRDDYPESAIVVKSAFAVAFTRTGKTIVPKNKASALISGSVTAYHDTFIFKLPKSVGFAVKAVRKDNGEVIWTASLTRSVAVGENVLMPLAALAKRAANDLVRGLPR